VCQFCKQEFIAKTTITKCCSANCAKRLHKLKLRGDKIEQTITETKAIINKPIIELQVKEYLSVQEVCTLTGVSRWTIAEMIKKGTIKSGRFGRRIIIQKKDLDSIF